jgi:pyruvate dehydrogenase E2 component (dihydrolipoamide acetyltransferase)
MAISVVMPALELTQESGKLIAWRKKEGESVTKGEILLEVETDKAVVEVESPGDGILASVSAREGAEIPVGQTIAWIVQPGEEAPTTTSKSHPSARATVPPARTSAAAAAAAGTSSASDLKISPKARRLAREQGVDINRISGSGPGGEILASDILAAVEPKGGVAVPTAEKLGSVGRLMAERTTQSWTSVPHFFVVREMDAGALVAARERITAAIEKSHGVRLTHTDLLIAIIARALRKHPLLNALWVSDSIQLHSQVNIGIAMAVENGVVVAVVQNADSKNLGDIAARRHELAERTRAGRLHPPDVSGATFTISNLGMYNVDAFTAIIGPSQSAILAVGRIADRVVAVDGKPAVRPMITLSLSCDHRVVSGAQAAMFLEEVAEVIRKSPDSLE